MDMEEKIATATQYLQDCGCDADEISNYLVYVNDSKTKGQIFILERHRKKLMDRLHSVQRMVDRTDFIIHQLEQGTLN